jgi:hypothetical protein
MLGRFIYWHVVKKPLPQYVGGEGPTENVILKLY